MSEDPSTRIALVTGAGRGIGKAIAEALADAGHTVLCISKNPTSCGAVADAINQSGGKAHALAVDVADGNAVAEAAAELSKEHGTIEILVNNAGITRDGLIFRMSDEDWDSVIQTNLTSCFHWCRALGRPMTRSRWGRIVNISSVTGVVGNAGQANYAAAKSGMLGLTKTLAKEFAGRNVTVNAVAPGFIQTDMTEGLSDEVKEAASKFIPLKRFGVVEDISHIVEFLCSPKAGYITGQVFSVDGGMAM